MPKEPIYLAHGAGAGHKASRVLTLFSNYMINQYDRPITPVTFQYMKDQEQLGTKRPPPRFTTLIPEFIEQIKEEGAVIVAGKSMGGRVATQLSNQNNVKAVVCLGFPFHPPGKPEKHRLSFLEEINVPCLIIQGTRDALGKADWVNSQSLNKNVDVFWVEGADHDFNTLKKQNLTIEQVMSSMTDVVENWLKKHGLASL